MTAIIFIAMLVVLVVGHEFGHLVAAKRLGMRALEFGIGFPPKLFGRKIGDTEYSVNALPFGGFVKILGEDAAETSSDPRAFSNRPAFHQAIVIAAGPFSNFVIALLLSVAAFSLGIPAALDEETLQYASNSRVLALEVMKGSPAEVAGILAGDQIISITANGLETSISTPDLISPIVTSAENGVEVSVKRGEEVLKLTAVPQVGVIAESPDIKALGLATALVGDVRLPLHKAVTFGFMDTYYDTKAVFLGLITLIGQAVTLSADLSQISGPVGIATLAGDAAEIGFGSILAFAAIISVNLGVINLLPFPALDGGRLALLGVETIMRKKVPLNVSSAINFAGFALLILLMIAVTFSDISRLAS